MTLNSAMYTGVSGVLTMGNSMNVIGDNIANVNTIGFKANRSVFADILANNMANGDTMMQVGRGVRTADIQTSWAQGAPETTQNATDVAIQGEGFFQVHDAANNAYYYTRAGQFTINQNGNLVNPQGLIVQGKQITNGIGNTTTVSGGATDIDLSNVQSMPRATSNFRVGMNLNAAASANSTFNTSFDVYNNLGDRVTMSFNMTKTSPLNWSYSITPSNGTMVAGASGVMTFDNTGALVTPAANQTVSISGFATGAAQLDMTWQMFDPATLAQLGDITGYTAPNTTTYIEQDGRSNGTLTGLSVGTDGWITGLFSNGQTDPLYELSLVKFTSPWGLERLGGQTFAETRDSGQPITGRAGVGGLGTVLGSSLELSNVDLASEFVKMIQHQRAYQASARVITTADDMLTEAVNLKR